MVAPRHLLLALGLFLTFANTLAANQEDVDPSEELLEKILPGAVRHSHKHHHKPKPPKKPKDPNKPKKPKKPKKCTAGCEKPNKAKRKCKFYGGHCKQKKKKCAAGEKFNSKWCRGFCGCCYKEFEPLKCGETAHCKAHNGTHQDARHPCPGGDQINQYSDKDGCTCCVKTVKPPIDHHKDNWRTGRFSSSDGRSYLYTTAPYSWRSCNSYCGENDAAQANVTDLAVMAHDLITNAPGHDFWTKSCDGLSGCIDFRPSYYPHVSCYTYKCYYHQGCLCVLE